jgi:hypothetical protein
MPSFRLLIRGALFLSCSFHSLVGAVPHRTSKPSIAPRAEPADPNQLPCSLIFGNDTGRLIRFKDVGDG